MADRPGPLDTFAPGLFAGRVAVVTGGGTGIGRETVLGFARFGADVVLAGRTPETLEATATEAATLGVQALAVPTNIRDVEAVDALRDAAYARFGRVDCLINNAGGQFPARPSEISDNGWRAVVDLNLNGTWNMISRFMGPMAQAGTGSIVNVVHTFSYERGAPAFAHSGAARAGVVNLTKTMASYLVHHGVTINAFAPGPIDTAGLQENEVEQLGRTAEGFEAEITEVAGRGARLGSAEEMAAIVLFLCSPAARYITGTSVIADGGSMVANWIEFFPPGEL
jgi:NAD(P)-dependent dehydrogenase (short-subunit alcohol dehydrogenase family)